MKFQQPGCNKDVVRRALLGFGCNGGGSSSGRGGAQQRDREEAAAREGGRSGGGGSRRRRMGRRGKGYINIELMLVLGRSGKCQHYQH